MGLRTASVRRPNVDVMAPALTDTAQAQNFNIPPKSHLEPASPINSFETNKYAPTIAKKCSEPASPLNTDDLSTSLDTLNSLCPTTTNIQFDRYLTDLNGASDNILLQNNMSLSSSPMGDREDKMGLQKTGLNVSNVNKMKSTNEDDQMFNPNLEPNVEDIMQKVMESIGNSDQLNNSASDLTEDLDMQIDKELLEHVDNIIDISIDDQQDDLEQAQKIKENQAYTLLSELQRKHLRLERRLDFLKRRSFKLQSKLTGQHVGSEVVGVFEQVHRSIKKPKDSLSDPTKPFGNISTFESTEKPEKLKPMSASSAKSLARKLEMAKMLQANSSARQKNIPKYFGSGSIEASVFRSNTGGQVSIPQWSDEHRTELRNVSDQLKLQLHLVQKEMDSEVTESSSGAESCDELQSYNNPHQQYLSIQKRALWKYSTDRAAIAARWTWVQSQISDLEYRIRQHTDLHKQIRSAKGTVKLGEVVICSPPVQSQSEIAGHHDYGAAPVESATNSPTALNGYLGQLPGAIGSKTTENEECHHQCARTRPLVSFRKRRLLQIDGLHAISKKAARPSTVRCNCAASQAPCALCTGRVDPTHPRDSPDTLGKAEKVALLDPGYHPVLSLSEDTSQTLHLEAIMKMHEWQQRSLKMKTIKVLHKPENSERDTRYEHRSKKLEHRKKYNRLKSSTVSALSEKIKKKLRGRKKGRPSTKYSKSSSYGALSQHLQGMDTTGSEDAEVEATLSSGSHLLGGGGSQTRLASFDSPGGSPLLQMQSISGYKQNNRTTRVDSYDIDNIVIPYSVAASTRVEKLQYKEILTPKWRIAEDDIFIKSEKNNGSVGDLLDENDVEDMSDEALIARHDRCELEEKKRFLSYLKFPLGYTRQRSHKRHDSLAESSGGNTPDPASPHPDGAKSGAESASALMGSPPPTPGPPTDESSLPSIALMRRRTVSQSRFREVKEEGPPVDYVEQPPYEVRTFPLSDTDFERIIEDMPDAFREVMTNYRAQDTGEDAISKTELPDSADSESTESAIGEDALIDEEEEHLMEEDDEDEEDPNDPEWTDVEKPTTYHRERHHHRR